MRLGSVPLSPDTYLCQLPQLSWKVLRNIKVGWEAKQTFKDIYTHIRLRLQIMHFPLLLFHTQISEDHTSSHAHLSKQRIETHILVGMVGLLVGYRDKYGSIWCVNSACKAPTTWTPSFVVLWSATLLHVKSFLQLTTGLDRTGFVWPRGALSLLEQ